MGQVGTRRARAAAPASTRGPVPSVPAPADPSSIWRNSAWSSVALKSPSSSRLPGRAARRPKAANSLRHCPARPHTGALVCTLVTAREACRPPASSSNCTVGMWKAEPSTESNGTIGREEYTAPPPAPSLERLIRCGSSAPNPSASSRLSMAGDSSWTARSSTPFSRTSRTTSAASAWPFQALRAMTFSSADGRCPLFCPGPCPVPCPVDSSCPCKGPA